MPSRRRTWFLVRLALYSTVVVVLFLVRGGAAWRRLADSVIRREPVAPKLTVGGRDLAPFLVDRLLTAYAQDYPELIIRPLGGGTNQALEDLLYGKADAAFLFRPPTAAEQELFRLADGDTAIVMPVAVGAVLVLAAETDDAPALTPDLLREALAARRPPPPRRIYVPDPNEGLWDAVRLALGLPDAEPAAGSPVVFLADAAAVLGAVAAGAGLDPAQPGHRAWGLVSSLDAPVDPDAGPPPGLRFLDARTAPDSAAAPPTYVNVATGAYPLHHVLLVACRADGNRSGANFVTHLTSARGLRQIERAGVLPIRQVLREIYLTREPLGE